MKPHFFGLGVGHLSRDIRKKAEELGASLINHTEAQCNCGKGCAAHHCEMAKRHWFEIPDHGEAINRERARAIIGAIGDYKRQKLEAEAKKIRTRLAEIEKELEEEDIYDL